MAIHTGHHSTPSPPLIQVLLTYGAQPSQLIDSTLDTPDALRYVDLRKAAPGWLPPVVIEHERVPRLFIFDGRAANGTGEVAQAEVEQWCRRILLRGDPAWTAILRPGRLDVLSFEIVGQNVKAATESLQPDSGALARFIYDVRSGAADLPRRAYLKELLARSMAQAVGLGVGDIDAISLVGWGLFWRFLVDRDLLVGKNPNDIAQGATSWTDCLNSKPRALATLAWLDNTFNGGLLPFEQSPEHYAPEVFSRVLGNIAAGATHQGQLRLPTDWDEINFSHVPVGLLSEVYEAFSADLDLPAAKRQSIHYTPRHIAEFLVGEVMDAQADVARPCVLDPAVGAGVFLIATFRALAKREWERSGLRPNRQIIRRILDQQLYAFDVDPKALRLTQLGLYLTALELDPDPTPIEDLKFGSLDATLRLRTGPDGSLGSVASGDVGRFDIVVGNPPWTVCDLKSKQRWVKQTDASVLARLGDAAEAFDLPDANPDLPFFWRAGEWAKPGGQIALIIHGRWLFGMSDRAFAARQQIFTAFNVTGVLNGADLRKSAVWPNVTAPFCLVFARNEAAPSNGAMQFVSPYVEASRESGQTILRVDWHDAQSVLHEEIRSKRWALKARFRGDALARRVFAKLLACSIPLGDYLQALKPGLAFRNGYQLGGVAGKQLSAKHMIGMPDLKNSAANAFCLDSLPLPKFSRPTLLRSRDPEIYVPPLLLVRESIPKDPLQPRSMRANQSLAYHESFHGVSFAGIDNADDQARLLQILLQSRLGVFACLLSDARYGVERDTLYKESLDIFPVIALSDLSEMQQARMRQISTAMERGLNPTLFAELNNFVFDLYGLDTVERQAIDDTLATRGPTTAIRATTPATATERQHFLTALKESLDDVLQAAGLQAKIAAPEVNGLPWRLFSVATSAEPDLSVPLTGLLKMAEECGASLVVLPIGSKQVWVGLPDRYRHWTRTQAVLLAHELLGGPLGNV